MESTELRPAQRFVDAQWWWLASELARRHSRLEIVESSPMDGFYNGIEVRDPSSPDHVFFNRFGSIHLQDSRTGVSRITVGEVFVQPDPHGVLKAIEAHMGWGPLPADATTRRSLTYRLIASLLGLRVNDERSWTATHGYRHGEHTVFDRRPSYTDQYKGLDDAVRSTASKSRRPERPLERYWILKAGGIARAILSDEAILFTTSNSPVDLFPEYTRRHRLDDALQVMLRIL